MSRKTSVDMGGMHYCEKHDQHYKGFLRDCPVCVGERLSARVAGMDEALIPNKTGLYLRGDAKREPSPSPDPRLPQQMSLFD